MQFGLKDRLREHNRLSVYLEWLFLEGIRMKSGVTPPLSCSLSLPSSCSFTFALPLITNFVSKSVFSLSQSHDCLEGRNTQGTVIKPEL